MSGFIPHTSSEIEDMLRFLGVATIDDLFDAIPNSLQLPPGGLNIPDGISEPDVLTAMEGFANKNRSLSTNLVCFAGGGAYDHDIASATKALSSRSEFVTAYTPYQPEVAQGVLQALFEYQTMVSRLSGLPISNASLYDGASALVEAINLSVAKTKNPTVWMSQGVNPSYRAVAKTFAVGTGHEIIEVPIRGGITEWNETVDKAPGVIVVGYPNYLGVIEDLGALVKIANAKDARVVVVYDPISVALLKSPGTLGVDVAVAEGQPLGVGLNFGGPYLGLFSTKMEHVRLLPGRLVGETVDVSDHVGYVTTLRTREQDIRREKASSNVCTNQTLIAITAAIQMSWLGKSGFKDLATRCYSGTEYLKGLLSKEGICTFTSDGPTFREFAIKTSVDPEVVIQRMLEEGFLAGISIKDGYESSDAYGSLLISVTEKRTASEIESYVDALTKVVK